ncbi:hypothetical protein AB0F52_15160 [Amycolatopsis sp. NPDC024027]|uniref:hypothetical protein n=1 Tax=Amycolatopsis sp. NPDC024027 TaxID=3154327 RepID=UPI00340CB52E
MPIDFAAIAARFAAVAALQLKIASVALKAMKVPLDNRAKAARTVEAASRAFPVVRFYDGAVSVILVPDQLGALHLWDPMSFGDQVAAGGRDFLAGLSAAAAPFRPDAEHSAILRLFRTANAAVAAVEESIARFEKPGKSMFDPDARTASDLFGLSTLAFTALSEASVKGGRIEQLTTSVRTSMGLLTAESTAAPAHQVPSVPLPDTLDTVALEVLGGTVLLGLLPGLVDTLFAGFRIRVYEIVLTELAAIESIVLGARHTAFEAAFAGLSGIAERATQLVRGAAEVFGANLRFTLDLWRTFGTELTAGIRDFVIGFGDFLGDIVRFMRVLPDALAAVTRFDMTELLRKSLGGYTDLFPDFALDDLLDAKGTHTNTALRTKLVLAIDAAENVLDTLVQTVPASLLSGNVRRALRAIWPARLLVAALFNANPGGKSTTKLPQLDETAPLSFRSNFPDVWAAMFGAGRSEQVVAVIDTVGYALRKGVDRATRRAGLGLHATADEFAAAATRSARVGRTRDLTRLDTRSDLLADTVFGQEIADQSRRDTTFGPLAEAFESWLAAGGLETVGQVIDGYVDDLATMWRARISTGTELTEPLTPTSPHLLRKHAELGRVVVPRLTLRVQGSRALDDVLADDLAREFEAAVDTAHRAGRETLRALAVLPDPEGR